MDFWMYFDFLYGILFDGRIITRKTRKSHRNTENKKNRLDGTHEVPSLVPHTEPTEINGMHEKGAGAEEWEIFSDFGVRGRDFGAERPAVEISYLPRNLSISR